MRFKDPDLNPTDEQDLQSDVPTLPRLFLREPGWRIAIKVGSEKMFCYQMNPGQTHYHRISDGEIYLAHGDDRLCLPCADRRGLLYHEPKRLREPVIPVRLESSLLTPDYEVQD